MNREAGNGLPEKVGICWREKREKRQFLRGGFLGRNMDLFQ